MIQRIQTIFIMASALLVSSLYVLDFADLSVNGQLYVFNAKGIFNDTKMIFDGLPILLFIGIIALLHFVIIFLYKNRIRQIRLLVFSIVLLLGLAGIFVYFTYAGFDTAKVVFKAPVVFPIVCIILDYLAIRNIGKDEALVRSMDRIR